MFGANLSTIYAEGAVSTEVEFNFTSAIRYDPSLLVDGAVVNETVYDCPDEGEACPGTNLTADPQVYVTCGCPYTAWAQCALKQATDQTQMVDFITCWDDHGTGTQTNATLEAAASDCSAAAGFDFAPVKTCNEDYSGERAQLLFAAANRFMAKWPEYAPMDGHFHVPHVLIGAPDTSQGDKTDMDTDIPSLNSALCSLDVQTGTCSTSPAPTLLVA